MKIAKLLYTKEAVEIYENLSEEWTKDYVKRYIYIIANYCNEMAVYHLIEKELSEAKSVVVEYENNRNGINERKSELTRARNESQQLLLKLAAALMLTPKSVKYTTDDSAIGFELP